MSSIVAKLFGHIEGTFGHLLDDLTTHRWLSVDDLADFADAFDNRGAPLNNCRGFVDCPARPTLPPSLNQKIYLSGPKRVHTLKYQAIMCANGIICELVGPFPSHSQDAGMLRERGLYDKLEGLGQGTMFITYGDPAYPLRPLLMRPYVGASLTAQQQ
ncbi:hypothetical protein HPB47_016665 [Ixodes persulcatus]|uniref:Uncharacterized protein n=1 Tax=Ixodes persulcatus TaxID=34615 RepID=A0AC60QQA7_IXOPE|nr:hypothetical protein HPB47_016665 [Ixodes persulcatus]